MSPGREAHPGYPSNAGFGLPAHAPPGPRALGRWRTRRVLKKPGLASPLQTVARGHDDARQKPRKTPGHERPQRQRQEAAEHEMTSTTQQHPHSHRLHGEEQTRSEPRQHSHGRRRGGEKQTSSDSRHRRAPRRGEAGERRKLGVAIRRAIRSRGFIHARAPRATCSRTHGRAAIGDDCRIKRAGGRRSGKRKKKSGSLPEAGGRARSGERRRWRPQREWRSRGARPRRDVQRPRKTATPQGEQRRKRCRQPHRPRDAELHPRPLAHGRRRHDRGRERPKWRRRSPPWRRGRHDWRRRWRSLMREQQEAPGLPQQRWNAPEFHRPGVGDFPLWSGRETHPEAPPPPNGRRRVGRGSQEVDGVLDVAGGRQGSREELLTVRGQVGQRKRDITILVTEGEENVGNVGGDVGVATGRSDSI